MTKNRKKGGLNYMVYVFNDDKGKVNFDAMIATLKSECWGWLG
jgi:hypothetical protein